MAFTRTEQEIKEAIQKLEDNKSNLPEFSFFGDNNHKAIDAMVKVLSNRQDYSDVYDEGYNEHTESAAIDAVNYLNGDNEIDDLL